MAECCSGRNDISSYNCAISRLRWFGHLERKDDEDWVSACRNMVVPGNAGKCRPRKTWRDVLEDDLKRPSR